MDAEILAFLRRQPRQLMVVATINPDGSPEAAVVAYSVHPDEQHLIFGTDDTSRKFANLLRDPRLAVVIGWGTDTLQLQGNASLVDHQDDRQMRDIHVAQNPSSAKFDDDPHQRWLLITPTWCRLRQK